MTKIIQGVMHSGELIVTMRLNYPFDWLETSAGGFLSDSLHIRPAKWVVLF
jgi:hypothetical protein